MQLAVAIHRPSKIMLDLLYMFCVYLLDSFFHKSLACISNLQKNIGLMLWFPGFS
jgi:hypothetical protein